MDDWIVQLIHAGGYWGVAFLMALENVFPPIPSELIMGLGGIAMAQGEMAFLPLLIAGTAGATLGNYILFITADRLGYERLRPLVDRWGRWLTLDWHEVENAGRFFRRYGHWMVFVMRFMPLVRSVISLPAGLAHMGHGQFLLFTAAGAAIWNTLLIGAGFWLGSTFNDVEKWIGWAAVAVAGLTILYYIWRVVTWRPAR